MDVVYVAMNMHWESLDFELPAPPDGRGRWHVVANTSLPSPNDICEAGHETPLADQAKIYVGGRSVIILVAR
jgi:glycogen operon protein